MAVARGLSRLSARGKALQGGLEGTIGDVVAAVTGVEIYTPYGKWLIRIWDGV